MNVIIGAEHANNYLGKIYVIFGKSSFESPLEGSSLNGTNGFLLSNGIAKDGYAGISVSSVGGASMVMVKDDIYLGASGADPSSRTDAGQVCVIFGKSSFTSPLELSSLNGINGLHYRRKHSL
ncbi:MAG: Dirigent protein [Candidatus Midichloria mitochondrii]|uniref:Uncharacterized protein n=1 Tax=Midichloria mitochondrii (strain IricVA) TaxID=696127 RepID=F7XVJ0_MIDMI|nr:hypothetical protein [Candidatus Midichloria mitochondrii]AEI88689.1 hypothetical protein midi_00379 [Candidatus Midichloria mitochondrii IricVA]MDJ1256645.1 hypothetical protein [Candidatus Midichloria mitochondrii]MDJ1288371.1 hypothetical protein [Candidatus Midichloria mitochondrii]MDJ1299199.1 hypothetical protein [Candidatus Midichloria mitochondrii]MDJ1313334.1 hypothetical protein [Candidatus Midichloria mitochondrii]